jgi:hypothetical protein
MTNDAEAQEVNPTATRPGSRQGPPAGGTAELAGLVGEEDVADPDAVIIEEDAVVAGEAPPAAASGRPAGDPAAAEADPAGAAATSGRGTRGTAGTPAAGTRPADVIPEAARPQAPANGGTGMVGDPERIHERWAAIQATFVDDPRGSVTAAAELVTETIAALVAGAEQQERGLRGEWNREDADTEELRNTLRGYRGLLDRLVTL